MAMGDAPAPVAGPDRAGTRRGTPSGIAEIAAQRAKNARRAQTIRSLRRLHAPGSRVCAKFVLDFGARVGELELLEAMAVAHSRLDPVALAVVDSDRFAAG